MPSLESKLYLMNKRFDDNGEIVEEEFQYRSDNPKTNAYMILKSYTHYRNNKYHLIVFGQHGHKTVLVSDSFLDCYYLANNMEDPASDLYWGKRVKRAKAKTARTG